MKKDFTNNNVNFIDLRNSRVEKVEITTEDEYLIYLEEINNNINFNFKEDIVVKVTLVFFNSNKKINNINYNINFNLEYSTKLNLYIANLGNYNVNEVLKINLLKEYARVEFYSATIVNKDFDKNTVVQVEHLARNTYSNIKVYYVLKDTSKGFVRCISNILKGSSGSEAHQELRLLLLDEKVKANSDPVLLIDENDIVASHANAIGMLDPDQVFYLLSRGLDKSSAQELIINGYFTPIFNNISNEELNNKLWEVLKGMI
ncbi:FeS assembly protein SufD [Spiroplasma corruscae]|uniref:FeS assembly protein SufD n=1 Tax=Spiroplasma corruscae TaxID=216934 RepID=A0A222ENB1_9MOLU|nr:SufD family Fe-S cluster assembly protein [Spiroplasma corruscae]ASP27985.1 FeS assembly protein SufD [Spiroplasma corruscae]